MHISRTSAGEDDPAFGPLPNPLKVLQWHGAEVTELPVGAAVLASSDACGIQAFRFGQHAYGMQFHVEVTAETVVNWGGNSGICAGARDCDGTRCRKTAGSSGVRGTFSVQQKCAFALWQLQNNLVQIGVLSARMILASSGTDPYFSI
jgi:hypothetical protein